MTSSKSAAVPARERVRDGYLKLADGLSIHYRDYSGPSGETEKAPLLCLHGLTRNGRDFAEFAERYASERRVITVDFRGRGESDHDPVPANYTPLTYAQDVIQLLDALGIEKALFVGTSLGGLVTMVVAVSAPQRIAASILNDVGPELADVGLERIRSYVGKDSHFSSWSEAGQAIAANNRESFPNYGDEDWVSMARRVCRERDGTIQFDYDMAIVNAFESEGPAPKVDLWPLFNALGQKPLLVVRGALSDLLTDLALEKMHRAVPNMRSVRVEGMGHAPMLDEPDAVQAIDAFLQSLGD